jgi:hypothetical protein
VSGSRKHVSSKSPQKFQTESESEVKGKEAIKLLKNLKDKIEKEMGLFLNALETSTFNERRLSEIETSTANTHKFAQKLKEYVYDRNELLVNYNRIKKMMEMKE